MKELTQGNKKKYKTRTGRINQFYKNNKDYIDLMFNKSMVARLGKGQGTKKAFREAVKMIMDMNKGMTVKKAVNRVMKSPTFVNITPQEASGMNFEALLKKDKDFYKQFREMSKIKGKYQSFDVKNLAYHGGGKEGGRTFSLYTYTAGAEEFFMIEWKSPTEDTGATLEFISASEYEEYKSLIEKRRGYR